MESLCGDAQGESYAFIETLLRDWEEGANRFDGPGEVLMGHFDRGVIVAVGGVNRDPFADSETGRIRRVYVRPGWRDRGIGGALVSTLLNHARRHFQRVRLRAENDGAARLYERLGFVRIEHPDATHIYGGDRHTPIR